MPKHLLFIFFFLTSIVLCSFIPDTSNNKKNTMFHKPYFSTGIYGQSVSGCTCHGPTSDPTVSVNLTGLPTLPIVGVTYNLTVEITGGNPAAGYNLAVDNGTITLINGNTESQTSGTEITHTTPKDLIAGATSFSFEWTPSSTSNATFTYAANNVDLNGSSSFDFWSKGSRTVAVQTLPIKLNKFTGNGINLSTNALQWHVSEEINFLHYEIEKSMDGLIFQKIGTQIPIISNILKQYNFIDNNVALNSIKNYYRLKIVDKNNTYTYSPVISISTLQKQVKPIIYPNIINSLQNLNIYGGKNDLKLISLLNSNGGLLQTIKPYSNNYMLQLSSNIKAGNYFIKLVYNNNEKITLPFIVQ